MLKFRSVCTVEPRSKVLTFGKIKINFVFLSLNVSWLRRT